MRRIFLYLLFVGATGWLIYQLFSSTKSRPKASRPSDWLGRWRKSGGEPWVQVYDSDSMEEMKKLQAWLEEEEIDCFIYEQGHKDVHGNMLKHFGVSVPKSTVPHAQKIIAKMMV